MATNTTNEGLVKPDGGDLYDITVFNATLDKLDAKITELRQTISSALSNEDGSITGSKLADNTIPSSKYGTKSVDSAALSDSSVTTQKIANDAVTGDKIAADAIGNEQLAQNAVSAENIVDGIVGTAKLADGSVTAIKLASGSITPDKIAAGAITADKIETEFVKKLMNYCVFDISMESSDSKIHFDGYNTSPWNSFDYSTNRPTPSTFNFVAVPRIAAGTGYGAGLDTFYSKYVFEVRGGAEIIANSSLNPRNQTIKSDEFYIRIKTIDGAVGPSSGAYLGLSVGVIFEKK